MVFWQKVQITWYIFVEDSVHTIGRIPHNNIKYTERSTIIFFSSILGCLSFCNSSLSFSILQQNNSSKCVTCSDISLTFPAARLENSVCVCVHNQFMVRLVRVQYTRPLITPSILIQSASFSHDCHAPLPPWQQKRERRKESRKESKR